MKTLKDIREALQSIITDDMKPEEAEKICQIANDLELQEKEQDEFITRHEELRKNYVEAIKHSTFGKKAEEVENNSPRSLEECIDDVIKQRK